MGKTSKDTGSGRGGLIAVAVVLALIVVAVVGKISFRGGQSGTEGGEAAAVQMDLLGTPEGKPGPPGQATEPTNANANGPENMLGATH